MNAGLYIERDSAFHRLNAGIKLVSIFLLGSLIAFISSSFILAAILAGLLMAYRIARIPAAVAFAQLRGAAYFLVLIFLFQLVVNDWTVGAILVARFLAILALASLVTLTTRVSDMVEVIERLLRPLRRFGVNPSKVSLAISLSIRFLPVVVKTFQDVREAQKARGLGRSVSATAVPLIVRTLRMASDIAEALDARSYDSDPPRKTQVDEANHIAAASRSFALHSNLRDVK